MPAGRGHCLQTESDSFLSVPENSAAQLAQEVRLLQEGSPERLFWPPSKDHKQLLGGEQLENPKFRFFCRELLQHR